jgi:hypothetical protein
MSKHRYKATASRFLRAADHPVGARYRIRIQHTAVEVLSNNGEERECDILYFTGVPGGLQLPEVKPLVLNVTNTRTLEALFGPDPDSCRDQVVELRVGLTNYPVPGTHTFIIEAVPAASGASPEPEVVAPAANTRPRRPVKTPAKGKGNPAAAAVVDELDDDIPY